MTIPDPKDTSQPKPLRLVAAIGALITLIVGGLPVFGVAVTAAQIGVAGGVIGALSVIAVVLIGEPQVTPVSSPRDNQGNRLVPANATGTNEGKYLG
jgi:hypothetical protein